MNRSDWVSMAAVAIALASAVFSGLQYRLARQKDRREQAAKHPHVDATATVSTELPGWYEIDVVVANRLDERIYLTQLRALGRERPLIMSNANRTKGGGFGGTVRLPPPDPATVKPTNTLDLDRRLGEAGDDGIEGVDGMRMRIRMRDSYKATIPLLFSPRPKSGLVAFSLTYERAGARSESQTTTFSVRLPSETAKAAQATSSDIAGS